jgi:hypothetical protein
MTTDPDNAGREQDGRFSPGCSGNPAGKKARTRHKATQAALALLSGEVDGLTRKAVELALAGDVTALRLCHERLVPPCRAAPISLDLPRLETRADVPRVLSFLLAEADRGEATPGEAEKLARLVSENHKAVQLAGFVKTRYKGLAKNTHRLLVTCALTNLYLMRRRLWRLSGA